MNPEEIEKIISKAIQDHNDLCAHDNEMIPHHRVMPIVRHALSGEGDSEPNKSILHKCPICKEMAGKTYLMSMLPTICQKCDHSWFRA